MDDREVVTRRTVAGGSLIDGVLAGERRALSRLLSRIEDGSDDELADIVKALHPHTGDADVIVITGPPGAGKSTLTSAVVGHLRESGRTVGVVAVDPSSPFTGGALLGDRVRMHTHTLDEGVFIRSMASRGRLGGLSWVTPHGLLALDAAGFDWIVVETVGVGQAEVEVCGLADATLVVVAPGMGDAIQAAKAGILEVADVFAVNKADTQGAERAVRELLTMLERGGSDRTPEVCRTVATTGEGVADLVAAIDRHLSWVEESGAQAANRRRLARLQIEQIVSRAMRRRVATVDDGELFDDLVDRVAARSTDPYSAAERLLTQVAPPRG